MKRKYREAARDKLRLQDSYIDGVDDDDAIDMLDHHQEYEPMYDPSDDGYQDDSKIPF